MAEPENIIVFQPVRSQGDAGLFVHEQGSMVLLSGGNAGPASTLVPGLLQGPANWGRMVIFRVRQHDDLHGLYRKDGSAGLHPNPRNTGVAWEPRTCDPRFRSLHFLGFKKTVSKKRL